ncbi:MAG: tetratricopeptide repeat protein [Acidobacteriaceae bacterium]
MAEPATPAISLAAHLRSLSLDRDSVVRIATRIGDELAATHAAGRSFGVLTSSGVLIDRDGDRLRVTLMGVAQGGSRPRLASARTSEPDARTGAADDVFAFGTLLRAMCEGLEDSGQQPPEWQEAIAACLDPDPTRRPSVAGAMQTMGLPLSEATWAVTPEQTAAQESAKWGPFQLLQRIGKGSFGEVYRAWDPVLEREVALKLLLPRNLNAEQQYAEIVAEARAIARVRHPGIVAAYGVDRHDGRVGFWSDFVRGRTLQRMVETSGPLPAQEATAMGIALCDALAAVHSAGLLHRDIKASNCMRDESGRVLLMDFGLSQELRQEAGIAGTPNYMAPELLAGDPPSVQSDLYAVGVLLFYLCAATYPSVRQQEPAQQPAIPGALEKVIQKATERDPAQRWVSAARLGEALAIAQAEMMNAAPAAGRGRRISWAMGAAVVMIAAAALLFPTVRQHMRARAAGTTPAAYQNYLAAESTLDRYDKPGNTEKAIGLFQGVLQRSPNFALAEAGLASADWRMYLNTSKQEWADQANEAAAGAEKLNPNLAAVQVTLGNLNIAQGHTGLGMQELQQAQQLDPMSADAHASLAEAYRVQGRMNDAKKEFQTAIDLAPDEWRWPYLRGALELDGGDFKDAESDFKIALEKTPDNATVLRNLGITYRKENRLDEAERTYEQSLQLNPLEETMMSLGHVLMLEEKTPEAIAMYERAVRANASDWVAWGNLASVELWGHGDPKDVRNSFVKAIQLGSEQLKTTPNDSYLVSKLGQYYANLREPEQALPLIRKSLVLAPHDPDVVECDAESYELLGDRTEALRLVAQALQLGFSVDYAKKVPELKALRTDPRAPERIRN